MHFWTQVVIGLLVGAAITVAARAWRGVERERALLKARDDAGIARPKLFSLWGKIAIALVCLPLFAIALIVAFSS